MPRPKPMPGHRIDNLLSMRAKHDLCDEDSSPELPADEATNQWAHSDVWAAASGRVAEYALEQWMAIAAEQQDWERRVIALHAAGGPAEGSAAMALAEEQRVWIERWYFTCPPELHREITEALLDDPSFRLRYDGLASGADEFLRVAVSSNAARAANS